MLNEEKDLHEFVFRRMVGSDNTFSVHGKTLFEAYSKVAKLPDIGISFSGHRPLIIDGARIFNALGRHAKRDCHLLMRVRDPLKLTSLPTSLTFSLKGYRSVVKAWRKGDSAYLTQQLALFQGILEKIRPKYCVVNSTIDPVSRLLVLASKRVGIRTACVQHGVYAKSTPESILEEDLVDIFFALDEQQKQILARNVPSEKIVSMATPAEFFWAGRGSVSVCLVGTDLERYGWHEKKDHVISVYKKISIYLQKENSCKIFYKPHPSEKISKEIKESFNVISSVDKANIDCFIGFNSTLLKEMSTLGKPSVQIFDENISAIDYEEFGYCKRFVYKDGVEAHLAECIKYGGVFPRVEGHDLYNLFKSYNII